MRVQVAGAEPDEATLVVIMLHGRGGNAGNMLSLSAQFDFDDICWLAPEPLNGQWYPRGRDDSRSSQEPFLTISLQSVLGLIEKFGAQRVVLAGFSDGGCVVSELLTRFPADYAGAWILSGALLGSSSEWPEARGSLPETPVVLTGSGQNPSLAVDKMKQTVRVLEKMGARVTTHLSQEQSPGITRQELDLLRTQLQEAHRNEGSSRPPQTYRDENSPA